MIATKHVGLHSEEILGIAPMRFQFGRHLVDSGEQCRECLLVGRDDRIGRIDHVKLDGSVIGVNDGLHRIADVVEALSTETASGRKSAGIDPLCIRIAVGRRVAVEDVDNAPALNDGVGIGVELHERSNGFDPLANIALINDAGLGVEEIGDNEVPIREPQPIGRLLEEGIKFHAARAGIFRELGLAIGFNEVDLFTRRVRDGIARDVLAVIELRSRNISVDSLCVNNLGNVSNEEVGSALRRSGIRWSKGDAVAVGVGEMLTFP